MKTGKVRAADSVMLQAYAQKYLTRIVQLLGMVPSDLLLLFKTNDCLRHLDALVGSGVNSSAGAHTTVCCMSVYTVLRRAGGAVVRMDSSLHSSLSVVSLFTRCISCPMAVGSLYRVTRALNCLCVQWRRTQSPRCCSKRTCALRGRWRRGPGCSGPRRRSQRTRTTGAWRPGWWPTTGTPGGSRGRGRGGRGGADRAYR
jgi:hypothetical protein